MFSDEGWQRAIVWANQCPDSTAPAADRRLLRRFISNIVIKTYFT